jgi:hypothetical protein
VQQNQQRRTRAGPRGNEPDRFSGAVDEVAVDLEVNARDVLGDRITSALPPAISEERAGDEKNDDA